jgi:cytochrome P450
VCVAEHRAAPLTARVAAQPFSIGGHRVEAGTRIVAINRNADTYQHPNEFRPERFRLIAASAR